MPAILPRDLRLEPATPRFAFRVKYRDGSGISPITHTNTELPFIHITCIPVRVLFRNLYLVVTPEHYALKSNFSVIKISRFTV